LNENYGIFVSLAGASDGEGTRASPLSSIQAAIEKAELSGKRVYVCKGTYQEALTLENGISVIGGYDCTVDWVTDQNGRSRIESPTIPAIRANNILADTSFMGFDVTAPDVSGSSASSIGLIAKNASFLKVANGSIMAGKGADGAAGTTPEDAVNGPDVDGKKGANSYVSIAYPPDEQLTAAAGGTSTCDGETGGAGGVATLYPECTRTALVPGTAPQESGNGAAGQDGDDGNSAMGTGAFNANGYVPADGIKGTNGSPGGGGSGGSGGGAGLFVTCISDINYQQGPSGGGGGAGGCGGLTGTPGKGGGASIAALLSASEGLTFDAAQVLAGQGGAGGEGSLGGSPTLGGDGGYNGGSSGMIAGAGQPGGRGGRPGISGSGAGGPSIGIAYTGGKPDLINGAVAKSGGFGAGVGEESKTFEGVTWTLPASAPGIAKDMYEFSDDGGSQTDGGSTTDEDGGSATDSGSTTGGGGTTDSGIKPQCSFDCDCGHCGYCESGTCRNGGQGPYGCYRGCG